MSNFLKRHKTAVIVLPCVLLVTAGALVGVWQYNRAKQVRSYVAEGDRYLSDLNYEQASICYQQALNIDKYHIKANLGMAECYEAGGQDVYAENIYRTLLERDPDTEEVYPLLADLLIRDGQNDAAQAVMADAAQHIDLAKNEELLAWYTLTHPTAPAFDYESGVYDDRIMVTVLSDAADTVYYTTDGSDPTVDSAVYTAPLVMYNGENVIRAAAVNASGFMSEVSVGTFTINIAETVVDVSDPLVENIIRAELGLSYDEDIHNDDIAQITSLYIIGTAYRAETAPVSLTYHENGESVTVSYGSYTSDYQKQYAEGDLTTLADLQYMPFLSDLEIAYQPSLDISAVVRIPALKHLSLIACGLDANDISVLRQMTSLTALCLGWNDIDDISALSSLSTLETLSLWGNRITDISPVSSLTALTLLDISDNLISDISPVANLSALSELWMYGNTVSSVAPVSALGNLSVLMVRGNPIADGESVRSIYPHLTRIDVDLLNLAAQQGQSNHK